MFDYFYGSENENFIFLQVPLALIKEQIFKELSDSSKLLYGLLLNRTYLSKKNNWFDEENRLYIIYTIKNVMEDLNCAEQKAVKCIKELEKIGLIQKKRLGQGKTNLIYVMNFSTAIKYKKELESIENTKTCENHNSRTMKITIQELRKSQCSNKDFSNKDFSNISSSKSSKNNKSTHTEKTFDDDIENIKVIFLENEIKITDTNIRKLIKNKNFSLEKLHVLIEILKTQDVKNVVGWLINGFNNFESFKDTLSYKGNKPIKNKINNFEGHKRDFNELEKLEFELLEKELKN